jgi:CRP-like cAMP-binding protein
MAVAASELAAIPLFSSMSDDELAETACLFEHETVSAGVQVAGEGCTGYSFFVIADGNAVVTDDGRELSTLGPGDHFGEIALLGNGRRSATVTTTTPARLLVMFGTEFRRLERAHPEIAARLADAATERQAAS